MKLLVDARCFQDPAYVRRGIGRNTEGILRHARRFLPAPLEMVALLDPAMNAMPDDLRELFDSVEHQVSPPTSAEGEAIFFNPSPMTHSPTRVLPYLQREHILSCAISLDLVPLEDPAYYLPDLAARQAYLAALAALKQYRLHAPISRHTGNEIQKKLGLASEAIVVSGAVLLRTFGAFDPHKVIAHPAQCRFQPGEYFIMVGGEDPRKNTRNLLASHAALARKGIRYPLLIVGLYAPIVIERLLQFHREQGGHNRDVQFLHGIKDDALCALYHRARACFCPSKSEGFSMPVIEAMACGAPVLASNCPAQAELVEQAEALYSPEDIEAMTACMERATRDQDWLDRLRKEQAGVPQRFAEEEVAARIWLHVRRHLKHPDQLQPSPRPVRPRLAFLTPYPAVDDAEIGYLPALLRELANHADITVFTVENRPRRDAWIKNFQPLSVLAHCSAEYDRIVTVLGLTDDTRRYYWLGQRFGGSCLLYESQLGSFQARTFGLQPTAALAQRDLGREVTRSELLGWLKEPARAGHRFLGDVGRFASPLIAHSRLVRQEVEPTANGEVAFLPPCCPATLAEEDLSPDRRAQARLRCGLDPQRIHLLHLDEAGSLASVIVYALEQLRSWGVDAVLHHQRSEAMTAIAQSIHVSDYVHLIPCDTDRHDWLAAADLAICLRSPDSLGVPAELFELMAAGVPTVANRELVLGFALPPLALEVPNLPSSVRIAEQWHLALERGLHRERLTNERAQFVEERKPDHHARSLLHLLKVA